MAFDQIQNSQAAFIGPRLTGANTVTSFLAAYGKSKTNQETTKTKQKHIFHKIEKKKLTKSISRIVACTSRFQVEMQLHECRKIHTLYYKKRCKKVKEHHIYSIIQISNYHFVCLFISLYVCFAFLQVICQRKHCGMALRILTFLDQIAQSPQGHTKQILHDVKDQSANQRPFFPLRHSIFTLLHDAKDRRTGQ